MYGIVPLFCNKMNPLIQMVSPDFKEILEYLNNNLQIDNSKIIKDNNLEEYMEEYKTEYDAIVSFVEKDLSSLNDCVILYLYSIDSKNTDREFFIEDKDCLHKHTNYIVIKFNKTIKKVWNEVLENNV
jgi:hypothetical protein